MLCSEYGEMLTVSKFKDVFSSLGKTDWIEHVSFKKFMLHQSVDGSVLPGFFPLRMADRRIG